MLRNLKEIENYAIGALDGAIGHVRDFYFDNAMWVIRYLVVETGSWLSDRQVLVSPIAIGRLDALKRMLPASLTMEQVRHSPDIDTDRPVSRQHEIDHLQYYDYPAYWGGAGLWGGGALPGMLMNGYADWGPKPEDVVADMEKTSAQAQEARHQHDDPHLRSYKAVQGYHLMATDGEIGHVEGLIFEEETWAIRYMVVNTGNWWLGHQLLIPPAWISSIDWLNSTVAVDQTRQKIKEAPAYNPAAPIDRELENAIFDHYGWQKYWVGQENTEGVAKPG